MIVGSNLLPLYTIFQINTNMDGTKRSIVRYLNSYLKIFKRCLTYKYMYTSSVETCSPKFQQIITKFLDFCTVRLKKRKKLKLFCFVFYFCKMFVTMAVSSLLVLGLDVVLDDVVSRALLAPIAHNDGWTTNDLAGLALRVQLAETSPLSQLLVGVNLDDGNLKQECWAIVTIEVM